MKILKGLLLCVFLFSAVAFSFANGSQETSGETAENEPVKLRFTVWSGNPDHLETLNGIADSYREDHPNVEIAFDTIPFSEYVTKLTLQLSGSNPPDGGWLLETSAPTFIDSGVLAEVGSDIKDLKEYDYADFSDPAMQLWKEGDDLYGIPFSTSPFVMFYNKDLFKQAGVPNPAEAIENGNWTWEDFAESAKAIKQETGKYAFQSFNGAGYDARLFHTIVPILRAYGVDMWNEKSELQLSTSEAYDALSLYHTMIFDDKTVEPPGSQADFFIGDAATTISQISRVPKLSDADFEWDIAPLPAGPAERPWVIGQAAFAVFRASKHPEVAKDFLAHLTNKENVAKLAQFFPPARVSVIESKAFVEANPGLNSDQMKIVQQGIKNGTVLPSHVSFPKISMEARGAFDRLWQSKVDVEATLKDINEQLKPLVEAD
ncbi:MAG: sugar ABC transporter substrate-binding protein [Spirochaetia bacterium]